jgi:hypothetical protein
MGSASHFHLLIELVLNSCFEVCAFLVIPAIGTERANL